VVESLVSGGMGGKGGAKPRGGAHRSYAVVNRTALAFRAQGLDGIFQLFKHTIGGRICGTTAAMLVVRLNTTTGSSSSRRILEPLSFYRSHTLLVVPRAPVGPTTFFLLTHILATRVTAAMKSESLGKSGLYSGRELTNSLVYQITTSVLRADISHTRQDMN
jgi:hypothetical protein